MEPEREYIIETVCEINDIIDVTCNVLKTPIVLEDIIKSRENKLININEPKINEITLKIKVEQDDIKNTIYFFSTNGEYDENDILISHYHDNLSEINEDNTTLIIDGKTVHFKKSFIPTKSSVYSIQLKFKNTL